MTDPIADMLTRIRNAYMAKKKDTIVPFSNLKHQVAIKLKELGYIQDASVAGEGKDKVISVVLSYKGKHPMVNSIKRISKPGRRIYVAQSDIPTTLSGYGACILSTSKGLLTDKEARKQGIGGELLCQIW